MRFTRKFPYLRQRSLWQRSRGQLLIGSLGVAAAAAGYAQFRHLRRSPEALLAAGARLLEERPQALVATGTKLFEQARDSMTGHPEAQEIKQSLDKVINGASEVSNKLETAGSNSSARS